MFDFSFGEILLTAVVALLVVGPKELPGILRQWGRFVGAARRQWQAVWRELEHDLPPPEKILGDDGTWYEAYDIRELEAHLPSGKKAEKPPEPGAEP